MTDEFQEKAGSPAEQPPRSISRPIGRTSATERKPSPQIVSPSGYLTMSSSTHSTL